MGKRLTSKPITIDKPMAKEPYMIVAKNSRIEMTARKNAASRIAKARKQYRRSWSRSAKPYIPECQRVGTWWITSLEYAEKAKLHPRMRSVRILEIHRKSAFRKKVPKRQTALGSFVASSVQMVHRINIKESKLDNPMAIMVG